MSVLIPSVLILVAVSDITNPVEVMSDMLGAFKRYDVLLSPKVEGQILEGGNPVPNVKVIRELTYEDEYTDQTRTDDEGYFQLPEKWIRSRIPGRMFDETRIRQIVDAEKDGQAYLLWYANTPSIQPEQTVVEKLGSLYCDLSNSEKLHHFPVAGEARFAHDVYSICRWE
ncbi:DUF6795 domain-containing protein [Halovibrio salipaludis]|nr:DUF6795 domain-containing protein [Halovibrio salipaludis]